MPSTMIRVRMDSALNPETIAALQEAEEIRRNPENFKSYTSAHDMMEDILSPLLVADLSY